MVQSYTRELCVIKISAHSDNVMGGYECEYHARYSLLFALLTSHPYQWFIYRQKMDGFMANTYVINHYIVALWFSNVALWFRVCCVVF